ncbi:KTSC domain-containing protein [Devosia rhizoryzae]|uniref:KTSC domain-containing protein n=1 Tax=Devosia rhizoryzae TaxID=2774137 RepID=A0ABX7C5D8_9HYPH|nr:KTSC domain-containing protein [Devosia rhizoryzae]QQR37962.1 KTSC domain-containing protein [Devosia rhizoryzae]
MSAGIRKIHYKPDLEELSIWFGPNFRRYKYFGVPEHMFEALRDAPSRTGFFNAFIKGRFDCALADPSALRNQRWQDIRSAS